MILLKAGIAVTPEDVSAITCRERGDEYDVIAIMKNGGMVIIDKGLDENAAKSLVRGYVGKVSNQKGVE